MISIDSKIISSWFKEFQSIQIDSVDRAFRLEGFLVLFIQQKPF